MPIIKHRGPGTFRVPTAFETERWYADQRLDLAIRDGLTWAVFALAGAVAGLLTHLSRLHR